MSSDKLNEIDAQIARLHQERDRLTADPKRAEVKRAYGELDRILNQLDELGEDVSNGDGYAIYVVGTRFSYTHGGDLRER